MQHNLILASQSPRRKELLALITPNFRIAVADIDEKKIEDKVMALYPDRNHLEKATILVEELAKNKALKIAKRHPNSIIVGADTVVVHKDKVLGKPSSHSEAYEMLFSYFGENHFVVTGVHVETPTEKHTFSVVTEIAFWDWSDQIKKQVEHYVQSGNPMDKAGAYGIQEMPKLWVKAIHGDYPNVMGLPISHLNQILMKYL